MAERLYDPVAPIRRQRAGSVNPAPITAYRERKSTSCTRARLADVEPLSNIDLLEIELEYRVVRHRLDHAADPALRHDVSNQVPCQRIVSDLDGDGTNAQLIVLNAG